MPADSIFKRELWAWARNACTAELHDRIDVLELLWQCGDDVPSCEIERNREQFKILDAELRGRRESFAWNPDGPNPDGERYQQWRGLANDIRDRIDLPELFEHFNYELRRAGKNTRRGGDEWCGACPLCGGTDRLRVWSGANGLAWCRQCGWSADAISAAQSLSRAVVGFYPAVRHLAGLLGLPLPEDGSRVTITHPGNKPSRARVAVRVQ